MKLLIILFISSLSFGQNKTKAVESLELGQIEFANKNYREAKKYFLNAVNNDTLSTNLWFNLAATQLLLGDTDNACVSFNRAYKLGDNEAFDHLKNNCQNFGENRLTSIKYVDVVPKFKHKGEVFPLIEEGKLNQMYLDFLKNQTSKCLSNAEINSSGTLLVVISIDKLGKFTGKVSIIRSSLSDTKRILIAKDLLSIVQQVEYIPASYQGKNVETWEKWNQPINF